MLFAPPDQGSSVEPQLGTQADALVEVLRSFGIEGEVVRSHCGPVVIRHEFVPQRGTKLSRIEGLESDVAMALAAARVRILAPIPGTSCVGFEVPRGKRATVRLRDVLDRKDFGRGARLPVALGRDVTGEPVSIDLAETPHLLVAGATGSGKSVLLNAMICSLLATRRPDEVRMLLIDLKMLEMSIYDGIPHLLLPVVTEVTAAERALRWVVFEMDRRYRLLAQAGVRDLDAFNAAVDEQQRAWDAGERQGMTSRPVRLATLLIVLDEFADLMSVAGKEVEQLVARLAAKARASGIHLVLATQRPSVDVVTGTIKNNFSSRVAFQVTSEADSRTILDGKGAKQLLGQGDMLLVERGRDGKRIQGCFVHESEVLRVVEALKSDSTPDYDEDILSDRLPVRPQDPLFERAVVLAARGEVSVSGLQRTLGIGYSRAAKIRDQLFEQQLVVEKPTDETDPLLGEATELVLAEGQASTSMLQRHLRVGYNRAARLIETLERASVIGPAQTGRAREVLAPQGLGG